MMNPMLHAGIAKVDITPPVGVPQAGYASRERCSESVDDPLFGKALVLDNGDCEVALITTDLLGLPPGNVARLRDLVHGQTGIPQTHVLACASHTHFGPVLKPPTYLPDSLLENFSESYVDNLIRLLAGAVRMAHDNRQPARIGWDVGQAPELAFNRRTKKADGTITMSWRMPSPEEAAELTFGPTDPDVAVLRVEDRDAQFLAALISFACHPVCGVDRLYSLSADYPGYAVEVVERIEGGLCLFALGCAGNQVPIEREGHARHRIGRALGAEALKALQQIDMTDQVRLDVGNASVTLPLRTPSEAGKTTVTTEIQRIRIGGLNLIGLPGEVFVEIGLAIKAAAAEQGIGPTFVFSFCNDALAYVPTASAYDEGGYEPGWTKLGRGSGERLTEAVAGLL